MLRKYNQKGFTLIELLIVIVIIGILAGVLIAVINPAQQQSRARDAGVQATINKVALAVEGFVSAYGRTPTDVELMGAIQNSQDCGAAGICAANQCAGSDTACQFTVTGNDLKTDDGTAGNADACGANNWSGTGDLDCAYHYYGEGAAGTDPTHFRIVARSFGIVNVAFLYDNKIGDIVECAAGTVVDVDLAGATDGDPCS